MVVCNNEFNGTERYVVDLAKNLPLSKFDVHVATPMSGPLSVILSENNIKEVGYDNGKNIYYSFRGLKNLYRIIKSNKYDVIHANAKFQPCLIGKLAGVKFKVETRHGIFYSVRQLNNLPLWRKLYEYSKQFFVDKFIATSLNDKKTLIKYFNIKDRKIEIIPLGIELREINKIFEQYSSTRKKIYRTEFVIGHIGRLTFQKAQEYLLEAFNRLSKKYSHLKLVIVGTGENKDKLTKYVKVNNIEDKVVFKGFIKSIYEEILTFDIHVLTSRYEGTGYVNLEAMALGIPCVSSDVGGISNFVKNGYDAILTEPENADSTYNAIEKLIVNPVLKETLSVNAMNTVRNFTAQKMADETADFYKRHI